MLRDPHVFPFPLLVILTAASLGPGCVTPRESAPAQGTAPPHDTTLPQDPTTGEGTPTPNVDEAKPETFRPQPVFTKGEDWIQLVSGEWLRGELSSLNRERIVFDSKELDDLELDWEDVKEVVTDQPYTLRLVDRTEVVGVPYVKDDLIRLTTDQGVRELRRDQVMGFIHGKPTEGNYWSGHTRFAGTVRSGNTDQLDSVVSLAAVRRTASSRLSTSLDSVISEVESVKTANTQTLLASWDYYLTPRLYVRPIGLEVLHDTIQNIDSRVSPYAAVGYLLIDRPGMEWEVTVGLGYRHTEFDSVAAGESDSDDTSTAVLGSSYDWELTKDIDLDFTYGLQASLEDSEDTNHDASLGLTFEFLWDLDFDFRTVWAHVGRPEQDSNGEIPEKDDLRLEFGVKWEF